MHGQKVKYYKVERIRQVLKQMDYETVDKQGES